MKYVFELEKLVDCFDCPMIDYEMGFCHLHDEQLDCERNPDGSKRVGVPDWCPLVPYEEMVVSELIDSINSQPFSDEPRETIRVELYKSENEKLGALSIANGLSVAQMVAKLIDDYKIAKVYVNHGDHGPEPRFPNDAWTMWHCCGNCDHPVSYGDNYCKHCGAKLDWSKLKGGADGRA